MISITPLVEGGQLSASELNRAFEELERNTNISATSPLEVQRNQAGIQISLAKEFPFWVRLTGHLQRGEEEGSGSASGSAGDNNGSASGSEASCKYSWIENTSTLQTCGLIDLVNGREGFMDDLPAIHPEGLTDLEPDTRVQLTLADTGDHYLMLAGTATLPLIEVELVRSVCLRNGPAPDGSGSDGE